MALPATTPIVVYAPSLETVLDDGERLLDLIAKVEPTLEGQTPIHLIASLWQSPFLDQTNINAIATADGLSKIGIDPRAPIVIVPSDDGRSAVVIFGLGNRTRFERWLSTITGPERARVKIGGEHASVLAAASDAPVVCLVRSTHAYCQVGAASAAVPLSKLLTFEGPTIGQTSTRRAAIEALPDGAHIYVSIDPLRLAGIVGKAMLTRAHAKARWYDKNNSKHYVEIAHKKSRALTRWAGFSTGAATGLYPNPTDVIARTHVSFNGAGQRLIDKLVPSRRPDSMIRRWSETPALFRVLAQMNPELIEGLAADLGVKLPKKALTGTMALMIFGLDAECPAARSKRDTSPRHWAFLMPSAVSVGVRSKDKADEVHKNLEKQFTPRKTTLAPSDRAPLTGQVKGGRFEIQILDDMLLVGSGRGSAAAALRRLGTLEPVAPRPIRRDSFFEAKIDLRAVDAAFASGSFSSEHRTDLLALEAMRLQMKPLLGSVDTIELSVEKKDRGRALLFEARAGN